jgi:AraC-like DNA-binding protein
MFKVDVTIECPESEFRAIIDALSCTSGRLSRTDAAKMAHLSPGQFSRRFKQVTGECFRDVQVKIRMRYAASLLQTSDLQVGAIAEILGYSDPCKFQNAFRRAYGTNATAYRAALKNSVFGTLESA